MLLSGHRSQLVVRRHGDDVAVFHRPGGEVRVGADDDPGVQFNEFCVSWYGFWRAEFRDARG